MKASMIRILMAALLLSSLATFAQVHDKPAQALCLTEEYQSAPLQAPKGAKMIFSEDFSSGCPADGWTVTGDGQSNWEASSTDEAGGAVPEGRFAWSSSFVGNAKMVSPVINTSGIEALYFEFKQMVNDYSGGYTLKVETSSDGGNTWNVAWSKNVSNDIPAENVDFIIDNDDVGSENFQFTLTFDGDFYAVNFWYFDDIVLSEVLAYDAATIGLNALPLAPAGEVAEVEATVKNYGAETITFDVIFEVYEASTPVYSKTETVTSLESTETELILFNEWIPASGTYELVVRTELSGDENNANDTMYHSIQVIDEVFPQKPLYEEFTSCTCIPCAGVNPIIDQVLFSNPGEYSLIKYQVNWPGAGDPYYTEQVGERVDYYNVGAAPTLLANSDDIAPPGSFNQTIFDEYANHFSGIQLNINATIENETTVHIEAAINSYVNYPAGLKARIAVVEKTTYGNTGSNMEEQFHNVLMVMLPTSDGTTLDALTSGGQVVLSESYDMTQTFMEQPNDLAVIVFIQDDTDKSLIQSEMVDVSGTFETYSVTFNVDDYLGNPVNEAIVHFGINGIEQTNSSGQLEFPEVFPGTYEYIVSKSGLISDTGSVEVTDNNIVLDIVLENPDYYFYEDFNNGLPSEWTEYSASGNSINIYWYDGFVVFYRQSEDDDLFQLMTPEIDLSQAGTLTFEAFDPSYAPSVIVGTVPDPADPENFTELATFEIELGSNDYDLVLEDYTITDSYLAFRYEGVTNGYFYFDNVRITSSSTALGVPENLTAEVNEQDVLLFWEAPVYDGLLGFNIYRDDELAGFTDDISYTDEDLANGYYKYYVTAVYDEGESTASNLAFANVGNVLVYCESEGGGSQYISHVSMGAIDKTSDFTGYGDYTDLTADVYLDSTYTLEISIASPSTGGDLGVWIDFNRNGEFEEEENLVCDMDNNQSEFSFEITIPSDAAIGPARMRIKEKYWEMGCDPCGYTTYGETEDYTVLLIDAAGIGEPDMQTLSIFPNPANDIVNITSDVKIKSISSYNYYGQKIIELNKSGYNFQLNTTQLTPGIYLLLIETETRIVSRKLIIGN